MTNTPAVGVSAGPARGSGRVVSPWVSAPRSALFPLALLAVAAAWLAVGTLPARAAPNSLHLRATYDVDATIQWSSGNFKVTSTAHVTNTSGKPVGSLTFNSILLRLGNLENLAASVNGKPANFDRQDQSVIVHLPSNLAARGQTNVTISYLAHWNSNASNKRSLFLKQKGIITAYRWIPWLSKAQQFNTPNFGESWVTGVTPRVTVTFHHDSPLTFATHGSRIANGNGSQTFTAHDVRDFNFSASGGYNVTSRTWGGVSIKFYYKDRGADDLIKWTLAAMKEYTSNIGRYPYSRLTVAETPTDLGMESPGMTWVASNVNGGQRSYVIVHETAHQWFYGAVGNNQALNPFVDEGVADFLTRDLLNTFRGSHCAQARLDKTVYEYSSGCYPEVVYVQGGLYIRDYREEVGANKFWNGMSSFYRTHKFSIAGTRGFWDSLDAASGYKSQKHEDRFPSLY